VATLLTLVATLVTLLTGCAPAFPRSPARPTPTYTPVPDADLYRRIAALPHVKRANIGYTKRTFEINESYGGRIYTDGQENPFLTLDKAAAVLRQGRHGVPIEVDVEFLNPDGQEELALDDLWFQDMLMFSPEVRYGPQPGSGIPPASPPVPTPSNWTPPTRPANSPGASA